MGSEYKETTLGEFAPFKYGKGLPRKVRNLKGKIPVFGSNGIIDYHDTPLINGEGIIIGRKGSVGEVLFSKVPFWPIDTTFYIEKSPVSDIRFIYYLLKSLPLKDMNSDSAVPGLNRNAAHNLLVNIPPLEEQKRIAHILGTLDDKIELNQRMNETLEAMARALFKAWFVDFEPVKAKMEGRPYSLPDEVMALFPNELVESELGLIPRGWCIGKLGEYITFIKGRKPKSTSVSQEIGYLPQILINTFDTGFSLYADPQGAVIALEDDILMVMDGASSGRIEIGYSGIVGSTLAIIKTKHDYKLYIYEFLKFNYQDIKFNTTGTSIPHSDKAKISNYVLIFPEKHFIEIFNLFYSKIIKCISMKKLESKRISSIRELILSNLLSM